MIDMTRLICRWLWFACQALATVGGQAMAQSSGVNELPAQIEAIDIEQQTLTLSALGRADADYSLAFGVTIKLIDGAIGTLGNLAEGDGVTALIDTASDQILEIYVVSQRGSPGLPATVQ